MTSERATWTFLSNHAHVLVCLAREPSVRLRDIAQRVGITERAVGKLVSELEDGGVITRRKDGRRNVYTIHRGQRLRHPIEAHTTVGELLSLLNQSAQGHPAPELASSPPDPSPEDPR